MIQKKDLLKEERTKLEKLLQLIQIKKENQIMAQLNLINGRNKI